MSSGKSRLDVALVERGLFDSREKARRAIMAAQVLLDGHPSTKPGTLIPADARLEVTAKEKYVGRGGYKLEAALDSFHIDPAGRICADFGASTGGFTDCLLQRGAAKVFALDVGHGQLDWRLRQDPRVDVREGVNVRHINPDDLDPLPDLAVADVSFISLTLIFPAVFALLPPESDMVVLIKPQFELSKADVGRGGIVREESDRLRAVDRIRTYIENSGRRWISLITSPITGRDGNVEYLAHLKP